MGKHKGRRPIVTIPDATSITLSTLANDGVIANTAVPITDDFYCLSVDVTPVLRDQTDNEGPIKMGWANADLSVAEIVEALDARPLGRSSITELERSRRPARLFGTFDTSDGVGSSRLNEGNTIRVKINRVFSKGIGMQFFVINRSGAALTGGAILSVDARWYGRWL